MEHLTEVKNDYSTHETISLTNQIVQPDKLLCQKNMSPAQHPTQNASPRSVNSAGRNAHFANMMMLQHDAIPPAKYMSMTEMTEDFWRQRKHKMAAIPEAEMATKSRNMSLPMARVKKIMRIDDDVRSFMIAADAPIFMAQAAELFIEEMTAMGWQYVSEARRRILQKTDIATAVQNNDQFDFLIDFLPPKTDPNPLTSQTFSFNTKPSGHTDSMLNQGNPSANRKRFHSEAGVNRTRFRPTGSSQPHRHRCDMSPNRSTAPPATMLSTSTFDHNFAVPFAPGTLACQRQKKRIVKH